MSHSPAPVFRKSSRRAPMSNVERQRRFRARHPGYYRGRGESAAQKAHRRAHIAAILATCQAQYEAQLTAEAAAAAMTAPSTPAAPEPQGPHAFEPAFPITAMAA